MWIVKGALAQAGSVTLPRYTSEISTRSALLNGDIGGIITAFLPYILTLAGIGMLVMLIFGGLTMMTASGDPGKMKQGQTMIEGGVVGFIIVFLAFFVTKIVEVLFGVKIL